MNNNKNSNFFLLMISIVLLGAMIAGCGTSLNNKQTNSDLSDNRNGNNVENEDITENEVQEPIEDNPIVTITMGNDEQIVIELFPHIAPNTVNNFISLIEDEFRSEEHTSELQS